MDVICAPRGGVLTIDCLRSLAIGFALYSSFCSAFVEVLFWGRQGSYVGWSICGCILGSVLAVLGWRYWAGGRPGGVGTVARGRVEAVAVGSGCWAGCGGLYKLGCHGSLALVNA